MVYDALLFVVPVAALTVPAYVAGRLTARVDCMRPAWALALACRITAMAVFGSAGRDGQTTSQSLPGVLLASFVLAPAAFAAVVGGVVGRVWWRRG